MEKVNLLVAIVGIALGLFFVYALLSLIVTVIQTALASAFQWRQQHLKRFIEHLFDINPIDLKRIEFTNKLYKHPLVSALVSKELFFMLNAIDKLIRLYLFPKISSRSDLYSRYDKSPSYIPPDIFSLALIDILNLSLIYEKLILIRLENLADFIFKEIKEISEQSTQKLDQNFLYLKSDLEGVMKDYKNEKETLLTSVTRISNYLEKYLASYQNSESHYFFFKKLNLFKDSLFNPETGQASLHERLRPNIVKVVHELDRHELDQEEVPDSLKKTLKILAGRIDARGQGLDNPLEQLHREIEDWFERAMQREAASYKRSIGIFAIIIGFILAMSINADTFNVIDSLTDSFIPNQATQTSISQDPNPGNSLNRTTPSSPDSLNKIIDELRPTEKRNLFPIGWTPENIARQFECPLDHLRLAEKRSFVLQSGLNRCRYKLPSLEEDYNSSPSILFKLFLSYPILVAKILLGFLVSGVAISLGGPFWFDQINRIVVLRK